MNSQSLESGTPPRSSRLQRALIPTSHWADLGQGWTAVAYLISGIIFWGGAGFLADAALSTKPWFTVIGALIGNFAGVYLVYLRTARQVAPETKRLFKRGADNAS